MLQALDDLSDTVVLENSSLSAWARAAAQSYLSWGSPHAVVTKTTEGKYHIIEFADPHSSMAVTALKAASYFTLVLPLLAVVVDALLTVDRSDHQYFYNNPDYTESAFLQSVKDSDITTIKALYAFDHSVVNDTDEKGRNALDYYYFIGKEVFSWLLEHGADFHHKDEQGTPLFVEICRNDYSSLDMCDTTNLWYIQQLYERSHGAVLHDRDAFGETGFMALCAQIPRDRFYDEDLEVDESSNEVAWNHEKFSSMEWLYQVSQGSVLQDKDFEGNTAFMQACYGYQFTVAEWLLTKGGDALMMQKDAQGRTPFVRALEEGLLRSAQWLYQKSEGQVLAHLEEDEVATKIIRNIRPGAVANWLSEVAPHLQTSTEKVSHSLLYDQLPKQLYDFFESHRLFSLEETILDSEVIYSKEKTTEQGVGKLEMVEKDVRGIGTGIIVTYFSADEQEDGFEKFGWFFKDHQLLGISCIQDRVHDSRANESWNDQQWYMQLLIEEILPKVLD